MNNKVNKSVCNNIGTWSTFRTLIKLPLILFLIIGSIYFNTYWFLIYVIVMLFFGYKAYLKNIYCFDCDKCRYFSYNGTGEFLYSEIKKIYYTGNINFSGVMVVEYGNNNKARFDANLPEKYAEVLNFLKDKIDQSKIDVDSFKWSSTIVKNDNFIYKLGTVYTLKKKK